MRLGALISVRLNELISYLARRGPPSLGGFCFVVFRSQR